MKKNKKEREIYCDLSFFMKQSGKGGCSACTKSKKCEEWYSDWVKRNSANMSNSSSLYIFDNGSLDKVQKATK